MLHTIHVFTQGIYVCSLFAVMWFIVLGVLTESVSLYGTTPAGKIRNNIFRGTALSAKHIDSQEGLWRSTKSKVYKLYSIGMTLAFIKQVRGYHFNQSRCDLPILPSSLASVPSLNLTPPPLVVRNLAPWETCRAHERLALVNSTSTVVYVSFSAG